jgi:hypothetical protein
MNGVLRIVGFDNVEIIPVSSTYMLRKAEGIRVFPGDGWHRSPDRTNWRSGKRSRLLFQSPRDQLPIDLRATYWALDPTNRISIYVNEKKMADCPDNRFCEINGMMMSKGENIVEFRTATLTEPPRPNDQRSLGYEFAAIEIRPSKSRGGL